MTTTTIIDQKIVQTDVLGRVRVSVETREAMMDAYEANGGSAARFAREHGVRPTTFASWIQKRRRARGDYEDAEIRRKLRMRKQPEDFVKSTPAPPSSESMHLVEVSLPPSLAIPHNEATPCSPLRVTLPNGVMAEVSDTEQIPLLKALLKEVSC